MVSQGGAKERRQSCFCSSGKHLPWKGWGPEEVLFLLCFMKEVQRGTGAEGRLDQRRCTEVLRKQRGESQGWVNERIRKSCLLKLENTWKITACAFSPSPPPPLTPIACRWGQVPETRLEHLLLTVHPQAHSSDASSAFVKLGRTMSQPLTREREGRRT